MNVVDTTRRWQRWLLAAMVPGSVLLLWPTAIEPFMLVKTTFVVLAALAVLSLGCWRATWTRRVELPATPVSVAAAAVIVALVVATLTSTNRWTSLIGVPGRYTGLVTYLAYVSAFLAAARVTDLGFVRLLARTAVVTLGLAVAYGLLQVAGVDPAPFEDIGLGTAYSFFGQTNFSGAWTGAVSALALMVACSSSEAVAWRAAAGVLVPFSVAYAVATGTSQGPVVALVALTWTGAVIASAPGGRVRQLVARRRAPFVALAGGAALLVGAVVLRALPYLRAQLDQALVERPDFWVAALRIFADHPVVGTGLDTYRDHFLVYRPLSHALTVGFGTADAPHSVPLGMLANGGLLLGVSYLAVVVVVGVVLVRGVWRSTGNERLALAGFGGVWWGYQLQSLVSFDVAPLGLLHWLSAGVIVGLAAPGGRALVLPGRAAGRQVNKRGKEFGELVVPTSTRVLQGGVLLVGLVGAWLALYPLRADVLAARDPSVTTTDEARAAIARFNRAAALNPADPGYPYLAAQTYTAGQAYEQARELGQEAARRNPGSLEYALFTARQAQLQGDRPTAAAWIREAVARDPRHPAVLVQAGGYLKSVGETAEADELLRRALRLDPDNAEAQDLLSAPPVAG